MSHIDTHKEISFIVLTWNSERTICDCLESISTACNKEHVTYEILVIDNGSTDNTVDLIHSRFQGRPVYLTRLPENRGTTYPRNIALRASRGDVICIMDSDAVILEGSLKGVFDLLRDQSIGLVAPRLLLADGTVQNSVKKFPSLISKLIKIPRIIFGLKVPNYDFYSTFPFENQTEVDTAISACWFFRRDLLTEVGFLDEKIFYSPEDIDYCLRIKKAGKKIIYVPQMSVLHYTQQITHKNFASKIAFSHLIGLIYFFYKHRYITKPKIIGNRNVKK